MGLNKIYLSNLFILYHILIHGKINKNKIKYVYTFFVMGKKIIYQIYITSCII